MLSDRALEVLETTTSTSFSCDLKKWMQIMNAYLAGGHAYHATLPTDSLLVLRKIMKEIEAFGFDKAREKQLELGSGIRAVLAEAGFKSVAAEGFHAPGVVVCYTDDDALHSGKAFVINGMQIAAGVPLQIDEPADYKSFRIGLFGLDKLMDVDGAVSRFRKILNSIMKEHASAQATAEA